MKKNVIFLVVDALRHDRIATLGYKYKITPNLDKICKEGFSANNHFANGCPTQMSFPSIFSSTYCLDFGGFNSGIKNKADPDSVIFNISIKFDEVNCINPKIFNFHFASYSPTCFRACPPT